MEKLPVEEVISYWDHRIKDARGSWEGVLWEGLPIWNTYIDKLQMYHLRRYVRQIKRSDCILDVGCGIGRFALRFANICREVWGIDTSATAIKICTDRNILNAKFECMDVRRLDFGDATFDWVFSVTCLQHITNEKDLAASIGEVLRVTKNGGKIILVECTTDKRKDEYVISLPRRKWFEIIENSGGKIQRWYGVDIPFLRRIVFLALGLTRKITNSGRIARLFEYAAIIVLLPFEYTVPRILKNQSWYTVLLISKQTDKSYKK